MPDLHTPSDWLRWIGRNAKRVLVFLVGVAVLLAGVAMLALPGPGVVVIIVGLVILATEFTWAEKALDRTTSTAAGAASGIGMIVGGIIVAIVLDRFRIVGISVAIAGVIGLATLLPPVQAWIEEKANTPYDGDGNPDD
jgi:drug/metabolite transporter (DMT)-like permease